MIVSDSDLRGRFPESQGYVISLRKQAIRITASPSRDDSIVLGASKFGGEPDLARGIHWPLQNEQPMAFIGQVRLEDVAPNDADALLPREGLLSFFLDAGGNARENSKPTARVIHARDLGGLVRAPVPSAESPVKVYTPCALELSPASSFPVAPSPFVDIGAIKKRERDDYQTLVREVFASDKKPQHQLLGYVSEPDEAFVMDGATRLVLQLDVDSAPGFSWGDRRRVFFLGQDEDLRSGDFRRVRAVSPPDFAPPRD